MPEAIKRKNKIHTQGYIVKRLRDSGFITIKVFDGYASADPRRWTVLIDPGDSSVFLTCYENKEYRGEILFELNDGGRRFPKNYSINTDSVEVLISSLIDRGVSQRSTENTYYKEKNDNG